MIFRHSLRFRIVISFCLFGAVLGTVFATAVYFSLDLIDDNLINNRLTQEIEYLSEQYQKKIESPIPTSRHIIAYLGRDSMPPHTKKMVRQMTEGFHEIHFGKEEYHIAVKTLPVLNEPLYLLYEVSALEFTEKRKLMITTVLVAGVILLIGLGLWIGLVTSRKVIAPVIQLAAQVDHAGPDNLPTDLSDNFYDDEVGVLARALERSMQRVKSLIEREKQFNRDASHELRTPVTVVKGALELLQKKPGRHETSVVRPLKRIERAVIDMENIIESLLYLAREEAPDDATQTCAVVPTAKEAIEQLRHIFEGKPVDIEYHAHGDPLLHAPPPIIKMIIINLIQNAFHNTAQGKIEVQICNDRITVSDTGAGIDTPELEAITQPHVRGNNSTGFGLGLAIVKKLCHRFNWRLEINSKLGQGTNVDLIFQSAKE
jgi:signal transduction histidine kinase